MGRKTITDCRNTGAECEKPNPDVQISHLSPPNPSAGVLLHFITNTGLINIRNRHRHNSPVESQCEKSYIFFKTGLKAVHRFALKCNLVDSHTLHSQCSKRLRDRKTRSPRLQDYKSAGLDAVEPDFLMHI